MTDAIKCPRCKAPLDTARTCPATQGRLYCTAPLSQEDAAREADRLTTRPPIVPRNHKPRPQR